MHADVVVAGHVCLDVIPLLAGPVELDPGRLVRVGEAAFSPGGSVANTGIALQRLGVPVRLVGRLGPDLFGTALLDALAVYELDGDMVTAAEEATSYSIVVNPPGVDRTFLHFPGANDTFAADDVAAAVLSGARIFHFGYPPLMPRMYADDGRELGRLFARARDGGLATSLDMSRPDPATEAGRVDWRALLEHVLPLVDVFSPSIGELQFMLGNRTPAELAGELLGMGAGVVAIKLGERGIYLRTSADVGELCRRLDLDEDEWHDREVASPAFAVDVAGTTGAGDCAIAGLLAALLRGEGPTKAAAAATAVGACCVEAVDATSGIPSWAEVDARVNGGWPTCT